jgi:REP element-mobilizing transposase RayT
MYEYRRMLPHYQKAGRALFVTFCKSHRNPFSAEARDLVLRSCVHDHGQRYQLHAAVVMPEHVHLLLTPLVDEKGWPYGLPAILKLIKGVSARATNKLSGSSGPVWQEESFDHVLRSQESFEVHSPKSRAAWSEARKNIPGFGSSTACVGRTLLSDEVDFDLDLYLPKNRSVGS